jgi:hypothetical protein
MENKKTKNSMEERRREETLRSWRWRRNDMVIFHVNSRLWVKYHDMNMCAGVEVRRHAFFEVDTMWKRVVSFTPRLLYLGESKAGSN